MAVTKVKSLEEYLKEWWAQYRADYDKDTNASIALAQSQKTAAEDNYRRSRSGIYSEFSAEDKMLSAQNALIRQQNKQNMALGGAGDSGYEKAKLQLEKGKIQGKREQLADSKDSKITEAQFKMRSEIEKADEDDALRRQKIDEKYNTEASRYAEKAHKADVDAQTKELKAELKLQEQTAKGKKKNKDTDLTDGDDTEFTTDADRVYYYTGVYDKSGFMAYLTEDGKTYSFASGVNPYTGERNYYGKLKAGEWIIDTNWYNINQNTKDDLKRSCLEYGVFANGYQPRGIYQDGVDLGRITAYETVQKEDSFTGKKQTVWTTGSGKKRKYWMWIGHENRYVQVQKGDSGWQRK